jgi:hypothetical protein
MSQGRVGSVFSESAYQDANHDMIALPQDISIEGSLDQGIELAPGEIIIQ